jgi:hypothetical protein
MGTEYDKRLKLVRIVYSGSLSYLRCSSLGSSIIAVPVFGDSMLGGSTCHHGMARHWVADGTGGLQLEVSCEYIE